MFGKCLARLWRLAFPNEVDVEIGELPLPLDRPIADNEFLLS